MDPLLEVTALLTSNRKRLRMGFFQHAERSWLIEPTITDANTFQLRASNRRLLIASSDRSLVRTTITILHIYHYSRAASRWIYFSAGWARTPETGHLLASLLAGYRKWASKLTLTISVNFLLFLVDLNPSLPAVSHKHGTATRYGRHNRVSQVQCKGLRDHRASSPEDPLHRYNRHRCNSKHNHNRKRTSYSFARSRKASSTDKTLELSGQPTPQMSGHRSVDNLMEMPEGIVREGSLARRIVTGL